jgi:hypothetical protein
MHMKPILIFCLTFVLAWTIVQLASGSAVAGEARAEGGAITIALASQNPFCARIDATPSHAAEASCAAAIRSPRLKLAATCASNQWCCRHDFRSGTCVKCCPK